MKNININVKYLHTTIHLNTKWLWHLTYIAVYVKHVLYYIIVKVFYRVPRCI